MITASIRPPQRLQRILAWLNESLDGTGSFYRRRANDQDDDSSFLRRTNSGGGINLPSGLIVGFVLYLVAQTAGGIWWAATMQAKVDYYQQDNIKLWQKVETHELQLGKMNDIIRQAVRESMQESEQEAEYIRLHNRKGD